MEGQRGRESRSDVSLAQLATLVRDTEVHLKALRCEHEALRLESEALRRCLDRAGVLPPHALEEELGRCGAAREASSKHLDTGVGEAAASGRPQDARRWDSHQHQRAASHNLDSPRARSPSLASSRGRSLPPRGASPRPRGSRRLDEEQTEFVEPGSSRSELYEVLQKILDASGGEEEQRALFRVLQRVLKSDPAPPDAWAGPGTPLNAVARAGRADLARTLLRARANPNAPDDKGVTPLHLATFDGNAELCKVLIAAGADLNACDRHGQTPLFFSPNKDVCKLLTDKRSDVSILNRKGQSALHLAGRAGLWEVLAWLSTRMNKALVELKDIHGITAQSYMQQSGLPMPQSPKASRAPSPPSARVRHSGSRGSAIRQGVQNSSWAHSSASQSRSGFSRSESAPPGAIQRRSPLPTIAEQSRDPKGHRQNALPRSPLGPQRFANGASEHAGVGSRAEQPMMKSTAAVLEEFAAAAVATAAMATAAGLEKVPQVSAGPAAAQPPPAAGDDCFDREADGWPLQAPGAGERRWPEAGATDSFTWPTHAIDPDSQNLKDDAQLKDRPAHREVNAEEGDEEQQQEQDLQPVGDEFGGEAF